MLAAGSDWGVHRLHQRKRTDQGDNPADTMQTVAWVILTARQQYNIDLKNGRVPNCVDVDGVGKGVADRLLELGCNVIYFRGNAIPQDSRRYLNRRAEAYGELARRLDPIGPFAPVPFALPPDPELREELCAPERVYTSDATKFKITPKRQQPGMKKDALTVVGMLGGRSPDRADAVTYLYEAIRLVAKRRPPQVHREMAWTINEHEDDWAQPYVEQASLLDREMPLPDPYADPVKEMFGGEEW